MQIIKDWTIFGLLVAVSMPGLFCLSATIFKAAL